MAYENLELERNGHVATIRLNRPDRLNALTSGLVLELNDVFDTLDGEFPDIRAIILTGNGRGFCSGADLARAIAAANGEAAAPSYDARAMIQKLAPRMRRVVQPIIAAVNGVATGAGFSIALAADIRIASEEARFASIFIKRGIVLDTGSSGSLPDLVGLGTAAEMVFTGRLFDADWALATGLVNSVVRPDQLMPAAMALAEEIAGNPPLTVRAAKALMVRRFPLDDALAWEHEGNVESSLSQDRVEAMRAFAEKRAPTYLGR